MLKLMGPIIIGIGALTLGITLVLTGVVKKTKASQADPAPAQKTSAKKVKKHQKTKEEDLRDVIERMHVGTIDYQNMVPIVRFALLEQKTQTEEFLDRMGPIEEIEFIENNDGVDLYIVQFRNGRTAWEFARSPRGRIWVLTWNMLYS